MLGSDGSPLSLSLVQQNLVTEQNQITELKDPRRLSFRLMRLSVRTSENHLGPLRTSENH